MDAEQVVEEFEEKYPGKKIIRLGEPPTEIICETEPTEDHPEYSVAISVLDRSEPHYHKAATERYEILRGRLTVHKGDEVFALGIGEMLEIPPREVHWAEGQETWIKVYATPGWTAEDHIIVEDEH